MIKKNIYFLLMIVMSIGLFSSCGDKDEVEPFMNVNANSSYEIGTDGSTVNFSIASNLDWTISGNSAWIKVDPQKGTGNSNVTISVEANKSIDTRSCTLYVNSSDGQHSAQIQVNQAGVIPTLKISTSSIEFEAESGLEQTFSIQCNVDWTLSGVPTWIKAEPLNGNGNGTVKLTTISINESTSKRDAKITVSAHDKSESFTVTQKTIYSDCWSKIDEKSEIILKNGYYADLKFSNNVKGFYAGCISEKNAKPYTQQELYAAVIQTMTNFSPEKYDYVMAAGLSPSTEYIYCVIPYIEDSNGIRKYGPMTQYRFTTKSTSNVADAPIGNVSSTTTEWHWEVFMNKHCAKYYMLAYDGSLAQKYSTYYDIEIAQMTTVRVNLANDYYINPRKYWMNKAYDKNFLVWTWGVNDSGEFSGNISYNGIISKNSSAQKESSIKTEKTTNSNIRRGDMRLTRNELIENSKYIKIIHQE